jgi:hypothetical protein
MGGVLGRPTHTLCPALQTHHPGAHADTTCGYPVVQHSTPHLAQWTSARCCPDTTQTQGMTSIRPPAHPRRGTQETDRHMRTRGVKRRRQNAGGAAASDSGLRSLTAQQRRCCRRCCPPPEARLGARTDSAATQRVPAHTPRGRTQALDVGQPTDDNLGPRQTSNDEGTDARARAPSKLPCSSGKCSCTHPRGVPVK